MSSIVRVEVGRFDYDLVGEFKFFKTGVRPSVLVRLTDEDGVEGWGQSVPVETWTYETVESVETTLRHYLAPAILGADPSDIAGVHDRMERTIRPSFSVGQPVCKAAIDLACYDLWGKQTGRSVSDLLGGARTQRHQAELDDPGANHCRRGSSNSNWRARGVTTVSTSSSAIRRRRNTISSWSAPCTGLRPADFTGPMRTPATTWRPRWRWRRSSPTSGLKALESPLPPNRIRDYQALKRQGALPILMDEGIVSPVEAAEFIALDMLDGIAMKVARCGGLWNASRIVTLLHDNDLHLYALRPDRSPTCRWRRRSIFLRGRAWTLPAALNGPQYIADRGTTDPAFRADGDMHPRSVAPGLGFTIDERAERSLTVAAQRPKLTLMHR